MAGEVVGILVIVLGLAGVIVLLLGVLMIVQSRGDLEAFRRLQAPRVPIAQIPPGQWCAFEGVAQPSEQGTLRSPLTGREGLVFRIGVYWRTGGDEHSRWKRVHNEPGNTDFFLVDGAGSRLRVRPAEATFALEEHQVYDGMRFRDMPAHVDAWVRSVYGSAYGNMRVIERMIPTGARLVLHGPVIAHDGQLWTYTPPCSSERLLIADLPSTQPDGGLQTNRRAGIVVTVIGAVLLLALVVVISVF